MDNLSSNSKDYSLNRIGVQAVRVLNITLRPEYQSNHPAGYDDCTRISSRVL